MRHNWPINTKILLVEDIPAMRVILRRMLNSIGFNEVTEASDGSAALLSMETQPPELVFSDWNMNPMTGLQLLQMMRSDQRFSRIPFIMVTANKAVEEVAVARKNGVDGYLVKPFAMQGLVRQLNAIGARRPSR